MGNSFRRQPGPTLYDELKTPVTEDVLQVGLLFAFAIIAFSFILIIPGIRGNERVWATIRVFVALWIGAVILVCNFGSWYFDKICTRVQYKAHVHPVSSPQLIQAEIGLSMGLRGINITLLEKSCGYPVGHNGNSYINRNYQDDNDDNYDYYDHRPFPGEEINYNERFSWADPWGQGRLDFGIYGGKFNQEFRAAKYRGVPYPIMNIAEYFTLDGEKIRWYRKFRVAGWYSHILLWTAFATYLLSILLFVHVVSYGALFMLLTGLLMLLACLTYGVTIRNDPSLEIHFPDATLRPSFNYAFWLTLLTGSITVILALVISYVDRYWPRNAANVFHHSTIIDDDIFVSEEPYSSGLEEFGTISKRGSSHGSTRRALPRRKTDTSLVGDNPEIVKSDARGKNCSTNKQPLAIQLQEIKVDETET